MKSIENFIKRIETLEKLLGNFEAHSLATMSDEDLAARAREIIERLAVESKEVRAIVDRERVEHPDRWLIKSIRQITKEGSQLIPGGCIQ